MIAAAEIKHTAETLYYGGWRAADRERLLQTKFTMLYIY